MICRNGVAFRLLVIALVAVRARASASELLFEDRFSGAQLGSWAPIVWFDLDSDHFYTPEGELLVPRFTFLAFDLSRKPQAINAAGGVAVEIDVAGLRRRSGVWAGVAIGSETEGLENADLAIKVHGDEVVDAADTAHHRALSWRLPKAFDEDDRIRIEIETRTIGQTGTPLTADVFFGGEQVVRRRPLRWGRGPTYVCLYSQGGALFDNLRIETLSPTVEFAAPSSAAPEHADLKPIEVIVRRARPLETYRVGVTVAGGNALHGVDFTVAQGFLRFPPGEPRQVVPLYVRDDGVDEFDETILLALAQLPGGGLRLGPTHEHERTVTERHPTVAFETGSVRVAETAGVVKLPVRLSHAAAEPVEVDYAVTAVTAMAGRDFSPAAGTLRFAPGEVTAAVALTIVDDTESENSIPEILEVFLEEPRGAALATTARQRVAIVDDEPGIAFDGAVWIPMEDKRTRRGGKPLLFLDAAGHLVWQPTYGTQLTIQLPAQRLTSVGDVVTLSWQYKAEGPSAGSGMIDLTERWGSGDLRWGVFDTGDTPISTERRYGRNDPTFALYRGYQVRLSPHVPRDALGGRWSKRSHPGPGRSGLLGSGYEDGPYNYYGHGQPLGEFSPLSIVLERSDEDTVVYSLTLNGITHTYHDRDPTNQPHKIDAMAINFPNPRAFSQIVLAPVAR